MYINSIFCGSSAHEQQLFDPKHQDHMSSRSVVSTAIPCAFRLTLFLQLAAAGL